jgi:outer membrane protein OmpA-like peptidoglycan-associated protein
VVVPEKKETPVESVLNTCSFTGKSNVTRPTRVNNECKAILDDAALRLQQQADATLVVTGNESQKEADKAKKLAGKKKTPADLGAQRAENVKDYLVTDKGIAAGRIEVRSATGGNSEAVLTLVPRGATYDGPGAAVTEPKPEPRNKKPAAKKKPAADAAAKQ